MRQLPCSGQFRGGRAIPLESIAFALFLSAGYVVKAAAFLAALAVVVGRNIDRDRAWLLAAAAATFLAAEVVFLFPHIGYDYHIFWQVGHDVWQGVDPYAPDHFPFLYPPNALPICAVFALLPYSLSFSLWTAANVLTLAALVVLAQRALWPCAGDPGEEARLPPPALVVLTAALAVSEPARASLYTGQLSIMATLLLLLALQAQQRNRPLLAGLCLALASLKVATVLPFLLLFARKNDGKTWLALAAIGLALCLLSGPLELLPTRVSVLPSHVERLAAPGQVNDYSFDGPRSESLVSFDHALYRLGLRDRGLIRAGQLLLVLALGLLVLVKLHGRKRLPRAAACALVALYATLFLYHRSYDLVVLVVPLLYSAGQARGCRGGTRWAFAGCALCLLVALFVRIDWLIGLQRASLGWGGWGWLVQATVLPCVTWLILMALTCLLLGAHLSFCKTECPANQT